MIDEETAEYADSFNKVMRAGIEAKYGIGILEKVRQQAEANTKVNMVKSSESLIKSLETDLNLSSHFQKGSR